MIELTEGQIDAIASADATPAHVVNPRTSEKYVLLPLAEYQNLIDYDDTGITADELHMLAWEVGSGHGWEDMDEYDQLPEGRT